MCRVVAETPVFSISMFDAAILGMEQGAARTVNYVCGARTLRNSFPSQFPVGAAAFVFFLFTRHHKYTVVSKKDLPSNYGGPQ